MIFVTNQETSRPQDTGILTRSLNVFQANRHLPLIFYERYICGKRSRRTDEQIEEVAVDLKRLSATCKFGTFLTRRYACSSLSELLCLNTEPTLARKHKGFRGRGPMGNLFHI